MKPLFDPFYYKDGFFNPQKVVSVYGNLGNKDFEHFQLRLDGGTSVYLNREDFEMFCREFGLEG